MFRWIYNLVTNEFLYGGPYDPPFDPAIQGLAKLLRNPIPTLERYDGVGGIRKATTQELANYDAAQAVSIEQGQFDGQKMLKAVAVWTAGKLGVTPATAKAEILGIYRSL